MPSLASACRVCSTLTYEEQGILLWPEENQADAALVCPTCLSHVALFHHDRLEPADGLRMLAERFGLPILLSEKEIFIGRRMAAGIPERIP